MSAETAIEIPWGPLGEQAWLNQAEACRYTPQQAKFAACRQAGFTRTRAAEVSGYSGTGAQLRNAGSLADKTVGVVQLRRWAEGQLALDGHTPPEEPLLSRDDLRRLLDKHARSGDPSISLRSIEALGKFEKVTSEDDFDLSNDDGFNFDRNVRNLLMQPGGAIIVVASLARPGSPYGLSGLPLLRDVIGMLKEQDPDYLALLRRRENSVDLASLDEKLANPSHQHGVRVKVWAEVGMTIEDVEARVHRVSTQERLSA